MTATRKKTTRKKVTRKKAPSKAAPSKAAKPGQGSARAAAVASAAGKALTVTGGAMGAASRAAWQVAKAIARSKDAQRVVALGVLAGAMAFGSSLARDRVRSWPRFALQPGALGAENPPPGLSQAALDDMTRLPLPRPASTYDRRLVPFTAALLNDLEWVAEVDQVRLRAPAGLSFNLETRRPLARVGDSSVLTHDGAVIPARYAVNPEALPRVEGLPQPALLGARPRAIQAAVSVLEVLDGLEPPVAVVDVSEMNGDPRESAVQVTLTGGLSVEWGRADSDERAHLPGASKRAALEEFLEQGPDLAQVKSVCLRWDETTYLLREDPGQQQR